MSRATIAPILALLLVGGAGVVLVAQTQTAAAYKPSPFLPNDPAHILVTDPKGQTPCGECHTQEWEVWKTSKHAQSFDSLNKKSMASTYMENMGVGSSRRNGALCMRCHYTEGPARTAVAGVSCESCHGAAKNWINVHRTWADGARDKASESAAGKAKRIADSRAAGMLRPSSDLYGVAANCFECHTVPFEDLVNRGQHKAGTSGFELIKRVDVIRHNFKTEAREGGTNRPLTPERKRVLFVVGRMLDYEYSLRGLAVATNDSGTYFRQMKTREKTSRKNLEDLATTASIPSVTEVLKLASKVRLAPNNPELKAAAEQIRAIGQTFANATTGSTLAAIDDLIRGVKPTTLAEVDPPATTSATAAATTGGNAASSNAVSGNAVSGNVVSGNAVGGNAVSSNAVSSNAVSSNAVSSNAAGGATPAGTPSTSSATLPGQVRNRPTWHTTAGKSGMAEEGDCAGCHSEAEAKMADSKHQLAARRLKGESGKARQIAELYGIGAAGMTRPTGICMSCHATVDEGSKAIHEDGVTCERCHGAGASYVEPHKKGGNPQKGMRALKQAADRAQLCSECHRISDERLLAAGHPSGANYDISAGSEKIKHWPGTKPDKGRKTRGESYAGPTDAALKSAFASIASARPIPNVNVVAPSAPARRVATPATPPDPSAPVTGATPTPPATTSTPTTPTTTAASPGSTTSAVESSVPPRIPRTFAPRASTREITLELEPLPPIGKLTTEELMLLVKNRIALIHAAVGRND